MSDSRTGDRHRVPPVSVRFDAELLAALDRVRGDKPRNAFILEAVAMTVFLSEANSVMRAVLGDTP